jgi:hypothetical protein
MFETVVTSSSFLPIIFYYTHKIKEWKFVFQQCKICDAHFLARSRHYELCSDECRKKKATTAKKEFDERTKDDKLEKLHENAYQYWYNRLRMLQKGKRANAESAAAFNIKFADFRKEAKKRKGMSMIQMMSNPRHKKEVCNMTAEDTTEYWRTTFAEVMLPATTRGNTK